MPSYNDFFGGGVVEHDGSTSPKAPDPRATSPDGLTYLDTGEPTPLYYKRMRAIDDPSFKFDDPAFVPDDVRDPNSRYKLDAANGLYYTEDGHGRRTYVGNDPARNQQVKETPIFTISDDPYSPLSAGSGEVGGGQRQGTAAEATAGNRKYALTGNSFGAGGGPQVTGPSDLTQGAQWLQEQAGDDFAAQTAETKTGIADAESQLIDAINGIGRDDALSMAAREDQQLALKKQSDLLDRILGFDPSGYAEQFSDNALARATALARSTGGGAAARQAGVFGALEQMPAIQAEAQRSAQTLENQRLNAAQAAVGKFGDLAYGVRGQDQAQEEFNAELTTEVANQFGDIFDTKSQTGVAMMRTFADIYTETIRNTRGYAEMDSAERRALWDYELRSRGMDIELEQIRRQFPDKDPVDVWLDRITKAGSAIVSAKTGGLL